MQIDKGEAVRGQNNYSERTLWHLKSMFGSSHRASSAYQNFLQGVHEILCTVSVSNIPGLAQSLLGKKLSQSFKI